MTTNKISQNDTANEQPGADLDNPSRRTFFKRAAIGGGAALVAGIGSYAAGKGSVQGKEDPNWPEVTDDFKPFAFSETPVLGKRFIYFIPGVNSAFITVHHGKDMFFHAGKLSLSV